jgi:DNA polymerase-3 subunit delta
MDALAFLEKKSAKLAPLYVLFGDEDFLKRQAMAVLRAQAFGDQGDDFGLVTFSGESAVFADVRGELETVPFLSPRRLVVVDRADPFVTKHRALLEKYAASPGGTGILVLDVKTWPSTTRLAKLVPEAATIVCKAMAEYRLAKWCSTWASARYGKQLSAAAAALLVNFVGGDMGQLDQELTKLTIYVGTVEQITPADVDQLVGQSRAENVFKIFDAIGTGQTGPALRILDGLFTQGEDALRILGAFSSQLRRFVQVARLVEQGVSFFEACARVGVPPFARQRTEEQLRHLGKRRIDQLFDWLLEADLGMKGSSQLPPRTILERLVVRLARKEPALARS